jgi:hypothetical protein
MIEQRLLTALVIAAGGVLLVALLIVLPDFARIASPGDLNALAHS